MFSSKVGTELDAANVRRAVPQVVKLAGLDPTQWTPWELRHSFVSLLSDAGVPLERIAQQVGHSGTSVAQTVYRKQFAAGHDARARRSWTGSLRRRRPVWP